MNRAEHLQWCKNRAMEYVEKDDYQQAVTSMLSDLNKHEETKVSADGILAQLGLFVLMTGPTRESITRYIQGFN
jgi:hypothetical protein